MGLPLPNPNGFKTFKMMLGVLGVVPRVIDPKSGGTSARKAGVNAVRKKFECSSSKEDKFFESKKE